MSTIELQSTRLNPTADKIVVQVIPEPDETETGIILVRDNTREKSLHGTIVAVGPGIRDINGDYILPIVQVGNEVVFTRYSGTEVTVDGDEYLIMREGDILAILDPEEEV